MKRIEIYRHTLKDGKTKNTAGPKGLALAMAQGTARNDVVKDEKAVEYTKATHGVEVRTAQTLVSFLMGAEGSLPEILPPIEGFGSDPLFAKMIEPSQFRTLAASMGNFKALLALHPMEQVKEWAEFCHAGLVDFFEQLTGADLGLAMSHSPSIELALWRAGNYADLSDEFTSFAEMEGVIIEMDEEGNITPIEKIPAPVPAA